MHTAIGGAEIMNNQKETTGNQEFLFCRKKAEDLIRNGFTPLCPKTISENKNPLLETPMNKLGLGRCFDRYFLDESEKNYFVDGVSRRMNQKDVLTLQEFIALNPTPKENKFLKTRKIEFKNDKNYFLDAGTESFLKLVAFLEEAGFNHQDWIGVSHKKRQPVLANMTKRQIMELPAIEILGIYESCSPAKKLEEYFKKCQKDISIKDIMQLTDESVSLFMMEILSTLQRLQRRLRRFGFRDGDGPFMEASLDL